MAGTWKTDPTSWRTAPRPKGWKNLRTQVIARDGGRCTWVQDFSDGGTWRNGAHPKRCPTPGTDVDHIGDPTDHSLGNLRLLCSDHHRGRTARQAVAARQARAAARAPRPRRHPGLRA